MAKSIIVHDKKELDYYKQQIVTNLDRCIERIEELIQCNNSLEAFKLFKFEKIAVEPLTGNPENLIEVINQSQTYLVSIQAVEYLIERHPNQAFIINLGNVPGYDIESIDGTIIAECFAATSYKSNGKLSADLKRLSQNENADFKYKFFFDKEFKEAQKAYYEKKYSDITIVKFNNLMENEENK